MSISAVCATALSLAGALGGVGCSSISAPTFAVQSVAITEQSEAGVVLTFTLEGENRNSVPLPLREVQYSLWLDGREVFQGKRSAEVTLSKFSTRTLTLPVSARTPGGPSQFSGEIPYRFTGTVMYETPGALAETLFDNNVRRPTASFAESGRLNFSAPRKDMVGPTLD